MKPLRRLTNLLAACAVTAAAFGQPALAADLRNDPVVQDLLRRENFDPGKKFHLFGKARGTVAERTGLMTISPTITQRSGNLQMETATIFSNPGYIVRFSGHGHEVHSPFDNSASKSDSWKGGKVIDGTGMTFASMSWDGYEHHPADGYDGPQGGGYPAPHGARDIYSYVAKGQVRRQTVVHDDNRSTQQRFADRFGNIPKNFSDRAGEANKKMFEHNPGLNRWGNSMEFINGIAAGALNPFLSAGEAIGVGDAVQGTGFAIDMATAAAISTMLPDNAIAAIDHLRSLAKSEEKIGKTVRDWTAENPNAAETVEAAFNVAAAAKAAKLAKAAIPGKAAVSGDFAAAYNTRTTRKVTTETEGLNRIRQNQKNSNIHEKNYGRDNPNHINVLSGNSIQHILYGDKTGGGHLFPGKTGKTTFPQHWSASKITHEISDIVTSPKTQWYAQTGTGGKYTAKGRPARWVSYETRDGIRIRTVYEPATGKVVTAFPDRTSNPKYNPVK